MELLEVLTDALQRYFEDLEALGTRAKAAIEARASNDDQALQTLDQDFDDQDTVV